VPLLLSALSRNAQRPGGAEALSAALERDHDGSVLDNLQGFLGNYQESNGAGILGHVLGEKRPAVESALGQSTGLDSGQIGRVLEMAAPIVMGLLGRQQRRQGLDAQGLAGLLMNENQHIQRRAPEAQGLLSQLLDQDGDGSVADDLGKMGMGLLGNLLKGRRQP